MNTAKSTTGKRSDLAHAQAVFADVGTKHLKNWTEKELKRFRTQPVVIPVGTHGFFVGNFRITGTHQQCWRVEQLDGQHRHNFTSKINAIVYCINEIKQKFDAAQHLLDLDTKIGRLDIDIVYYEYTLSKNRDLVKSAAVLNRCIDAKTQRRHLLDILKKTLNSAKYLNFGKLPL